jgi:hypothetical protein
MAAARGSGGRRLAHGWRLANPARLAAVVVGEYVHEPVRAIPPAMAERLGACRITLLQQLEGEDTTSRWRVEDRLEIELAVEGVEPHDLGVELLLCAGQALWTVIPEEQRAAYGELVRLEMRGGISGEIDEAAAAEKRLLLSSRARARSVRQLERYLEASFGGTAAEYVHALWHDVSVRSGPEHLPASALRARLEFFERWFPPGEGRRLWP